MNWFEKMKSGLKTRIKREVPNGIWVKCKNCTHSNYDLELERNHWICAKCRFHLPYTTQQYVDLLMDQETFEEIDSDIAPVDPLQFRGYWDKIKDGRRQSKNNESILTVIGRLGGHPVALGIMDTRYLMGTLGSATGEKICRLIDRAIENKCSLILICKSGGARMQESSFSLMQMARVSAKLHQLSDANLLYVSVLTDPTYGGVTASFAMLGDIIIAEPGSRIGFAGQNVIKQFLGGGAQLPTDFQIAESVIKHGFIDRIIERGEMSTELAKLIALLTKNQPANLISR